MPGKEGFDLPEQLLIEPTDIHIHKTYGNSFNKTPLAEELRKQGGRYVIVTGYCAEYCVLSTFRGAQDLDFQPILLRGGIASRTPEHIPFVVAINQGGIVQSTEEDAGELLIGKIVRKTLRVCFRSSPKGLLRTNTGFFSSGALKVLFLPETGSQR